MKGHILITGGTGFVGGYLANGLIKSWLQSHDRFARMGGNESHICADLTHEESRS